MKQILLTVFAFCTVILGAQNPNLLFEATYDTYSQHADFARGDKTAYGFPESDLQLRMFPGVPGKSSRSSLQVADTERVYYKGKGNFNAAQGTVSFWFQMVSYDLRDNVLQSLFAVTDRVSGKWPNGYYFRIIKNKKEWKDFIIAQIYYKDSTMDKAFNKQVQIYTRPFRWKKGEWHHIVITWNKKDFRIYLDGVLHPPSPTGGPRMNEESKGIPYDHPTRKMDDFELPQLTDQSRIYVGNYFSSAAKGNKTAYDNFQIYDRPLSASEVKKLYEEVMPSKKTESPLNFVGIPFTTDPSQAVRCFMNFPMAKPDIKFNAWADLRRDSENLYVKFTSDRPCLVRNFKKHDDTLWEDDSFEIHLKAPDNQNYQFIVNGNGAYLDNKNKDRGWNAVGVKTKVTHTATGWSAELTVPLKNLSPLPGKWLMDVCTAAVTGSKKNYYRWSNKIFDGGFTATGEMSFLPKGYWFTADRLGNLSIGALNLNVRASDKVKVKASYLPLSGYRNTYSGNLLQAPWKMTLPAGEQSLDLEASYGKLLLYRYHLDYYVDYPMEISFNTSMRQKKIEVTVDFANAGGKKLAKLAKDGVTGTIVLKDSSGKIWSQSSFSTKKPQCVVNLDFPQGLISGNYILEAKADDMTRSIAYRVPNMQPYLMKVGHDSTVPEPWTPVAEAGKNNFKVWNRVYSFNGKSPFPQQVTAGNTKLLISAPVLTLNGKTAKWNDWKITEKRQDRFCFAGQGVIDGIPVAYESELWFDGMYLIKWKLSPAQKHVIESMKITYRMPEECATHAYNPELVPWVNGMVANPLTPIPARRNNNVLWLSGFDKGFFFWVKSNANWVNKPGEKPLTARKNGKTVDVSLYIITKRAELAKTAEYTMVFQGTPARPMPPKFREVNYISHGKCKETTHEFGNTGCGSDRPRIDDAHVYNGCYPRDFAAFAKHNAKRNVKNHMYTTPGHLSDYAPDFDYWDKQAISKPGAMFTGKKLGISQMSYLFCSNATDAPADLWSWWCDDAMKKLKNYNGLYFDLAAVRYCESVEHGCAGIDAFGQKYISNDALGLRNFFLRCYKTCHKNGGDMMIHCHLAYTPITHITDYFAPGENTCQLCRENYMWGYCEGIPLEEYQNSYNQYRTGVAFKFILQNGRAVDLTPSMKHLKYSQDVEMTLHALTPMVVHDISVWGHYVHKPTVDKWWKINREVSLSKAVFHPYWRNRIVTSSTPKTYASWYQWNNADAPWKVMIVAGNFSRNTQKAGLKINFGKMGINPASAKFYDLWNNKAITLKELEDFELKGGTFMMIGIK